MKLCKVQMRSILSQLGLAWIAAILIALSTNPAISANKKPGKNANKKAATPILKEPYIASMFPSGGQAGTTIRITLTGRDLKQVESLRISGKGVRARLTGKKQDERLEAEVTLEPEAVAGGRDLRVISPGGASNRSRFIVDGFKEHVELEPNSHLDQAELIEELPVIINGQSFMGDRDFFRFQAQSGETIVCSVQARALMPYIADAVPGWFDACVTVHGPDGRRIQSVDDHEFRPDPTLIFTADKAGEYCLEIHDIIFRGREDFVYRLALGPFPFVTHVYPLGGPRGERSTLKLRGVNLPSLELPISIPEGSLKLSSTPPPCGGLWYNTLPLACQDFKVEKESHEADGSDTRDPIPLAVPSIFNGKIEHPGDEDKFVIHPAKGQRLIIEVWGRRLQSPIDSWLTLRDPSGKVVASNDDKVDEMFPLITHHADSQVIYTVKKTGPHRIQLRETQGKGGPEYGYRLVVRKPSPDFTLRVNPDNPTLAPGETALVTVEALRIDGFKGEIEFSIENLPKDFEVSEGHLPPGQKTFPLTITAPEKVEGKFWTPEIVGRARMADREIVRSAIPAESVMQAFFYNYHVPTEELLLSRVPAAPFGLVVLHESRDPLLLKPAETLEIPVRVFRKPNIRGAISVNLVKPPAGVTTRAALIPMGKETGIVKITAKAKAKPGEHGIVLGATLRSSKQSKMRVAPALSLRIIAPVKPASSEKKSTQLTRKTPSS